MKIWDSVKLLLLFILSQVITLIIIYFITDKLNINGNHPLFKSLNSIIGLLICMKIANNKFDFHIKDRLNIDIEQISIIPSLFIIATGLSIFISELVNYIIWFIPISESMTELFSEVLGGEISFISAIIGAVIVAPIVEEVLMRGMILDGLMKKYSIKKSVFISALLFGLIHMNIYQFTAAFIMGLLLGWIFVKTKSIVLCIITHGIYNSLGFILGDLFKLDIKGYTSEGFQPLWFTGMGVILLIIGVLMLRKYKIEVYTDQNEDITI